MSRLSGVGVSAGRASGPAARVAEPLAAPPAGPAPDNPVAESSRVRPAAEAISEQLFQRAAGMEGDAKAVLETTAAMALDPGLITKAEQLVTGHAMPAPRAVYEAANEFAETLKSAGEYLAERVRDVQDVRDRIVTRLLGVTMPGVPELAEPSVLLARDLAPADTADLDPGKVLALVTEEGGPTSHTAILARSLGIPAVVAVRGLLDAEPIVGIVVDGDVGVVDTSHQPVRTEAAARTAESWDGSGATADGHHVGVRANVGSAADAETAKRAGAEGIGLFRTEFCYLGADEEPDERTQRAAYGAVLAPFAGQPVVVRTLDAGADKPLSFLRMGNEPNPALGVRGLRVSFEQPGVLDRQLAAIAGAAADSGARVSVMAPMVSTAAEAAWFTERTRSAGLDRAGVMIEVPAAVLNAREILEEADFVSIGTNDLAQYVFAADRMTGALAELNDPWQPALLRLIDLVGRAAAELGKPFGVCGEAAADPQLARVLVGLGARSLSMAPASVPGVGAALGEHDLATYRQAAEAALAAPTPEHGREAVRTALG